MTDSTAIPESSDLSTGQATTAVDQATALQLRYTELLEKRVAQLEAIVNAADRRFMPPPPPPPQRFVRIRERRFSRDLELADLGIAPDRQSRDSRPREIRSRGSLSPGIRSSSSPSSRSVSPIARSRDRRSRHGSVQDGDAPQPLTEEEDPYVNDPIPKSNPRYRNVVRKYNAKKGIHMDIDVGGLELQKDDKGEVAFTFRKNLTDILGNVDTYSEIDVEAHGLRTLLKNCIGSDYPGQNFDGDTVNLVTPFAPLVHNWDELEKATKEKPDDDENTKQVREDLVKLLECVRVAPEVEKYFKTRESNLGAQITTYDTMWTLFAPKTKIVAKVFLDQPQILEVSRASIPPPARGSRRRAEPREHRIIAWCWDWNGRKMIKVHYFLSIDRFWGTKDIDQLFCYPLQYHKEGSIDDLCKMIRTRGERYNEIVRSESGATQMYRYDGAALSERRSVIKQTRDTPRDNDLSDDDESTKEVQNRRKRIMIQGAFIVDPEAFLQFGAESQVLGEMEPVWAGDFVGVSTDTSTPTDDNGKNTSEEELLLYPPRVLGYSTKEKIWGQFSVLDTHNVPEMNNSLFHKKLQLDPNYKTMIQALVEEHGDRFDKDTDRSRVKVKDVVEDKGRGLVLLLHGPPGVGKTLTAETIAEATGKPLFVVSVAEIGLVASRAEKNLEKMFYLAGKWEAVLLVDEADVFLEARTTNSDPNRNALVSVLLRVLEYYDGIMILTTNRITSLDIAVQSRIHLAIRYDDLTRPQKQNVFEMFLQQLEPDSISNYDDIMYFIKEYGSDYKLNGRQIRNIVSSALSLARSEAKGKDGDARMTVKHLRTVLSITKDFQEQLESITMDARSVNEAARGRK